MRKAYLSILVILTTCVCLILACGCGGDGMNGAGGFVNIPTPTLPPEFIPTQPPNNLPDDNGSDEGNTGEDEDLPTPIPTEISQKPVPHIFPHFPGLDPNTSLETVSVIAGIFIPADVDPNSAPENWKQNLSKVIDECRTFWQREFDDEMNFVPTVLWDPITGDKNITEYTIYTAAEEFKQKTEYYNLPGCYNVRMVYVVREDYGVTFQGSLGALPRDQIAFQYEFWLEDEALVGGESTKYGYTDQYGLIGSAHELGHLFGFPHPWELPDDITGGDIGFGQNSDDVMAYAHDDDLVKGLLTNMHLNEYMKQKIFEP